MTASENQIVVYQPNETVRLDVRLENETVWLTQEQIANLFGTKRPAITKHLANIYKSGELEREGTCSILEHMGNDGKQSYRTMFYNLDAILSVGYRVNSRNATLFRRWATQVLKAYLLKGYAVNARLAQLEDKVDRRLAKHDERIATLEEKVDFFVQTNFAHRVCISSSTCEISESVDYTGLLKVGDVSFKSPKNASELTVNCAGLKAA